MLPVVDIFAGPGGLGEGFANWRDSRGRTRFQLAVSIEKDPLAHATLRLRAFRRCFPDGAPPAYHALLAGKTTWTELRSAHPEQAAAAEHEARQITLGPESALGVRALIKQSLPKDDRWVLIGGPPCQAYSLAGRSRNKGIADYRPELDHRQTLYVEYLQILADHGPPVFVMENVKGLLSASVNNLGMFDRIREDLRNPAAALRREGRSTGQRNPRYVIRAVVDTYDLLGDDPRGYIVRAEEFGIPQRRHRVILVGVREDQASKAVTTLAPKSLRTVHQAIGKLPPLRSGLSKEPDSVQAWSKRITSVRTKPWLRKLKDMDVRAEIERAISDPDLSASSRGSN